MIAASVSYAHVVNGRDTFYLVANIKVEQQKASEAVSACGAAQPAPSSQQSALTLHVLQWVRGVLCALTGPLSYSIV